MSEAQDQKKPERAKPLVAATDGDEIKVFKISKSGHGKMHWVTITFDDGCICEVKWLDEKHADAIFNTLADGLPPHEETTRTVYAKEL